MSESTFDRVRQTAADIFSVPLDSLTADSTPETVENWDSMNHMIFVSSLEQEFDTTFDPNEIGKMGESIGQVVSIIEGKHA